MRAARRALASVVVLFPFAVVGCGSGETGGGAAPTMGLDAPDHILTLQPEAVYRVGGLEAPDWATFGNVASLRFDGMGNLYVLDSEARQVTVIAPDGSFLRTQGDPGEGPGELSSPFGFAVSPGGEVAVFDLGHRGFLLYDAAGDYLRTVPVDIQELGFPGSDLSYHPSGGVVSGRGGIMVRRGPEAEEETGPPTRPVIFYPFGEDEESRVVYEAWDLPALPETERQNLSMSEGRSVTLSMPAERAFEPGLNTAVLPDGRIVVADSMGYRLKLVDLQGRVVGTLERPVPPTPVTDAIRRQEKERRLAELQEGEGPRMVIRMQSSSGGSSGGGEVAPAAVREMMEKRLESMTYAPVIPVIEDVSVDGEGRIWVQRSSGVPGEPGPTDILTPEGRYIGTIPPDGLRIPRAFGPGGLLVRIETDEYDVPTLVVERLPAEGEMVTDG